MKQQYSHVNYAVYQFCNINAVKYLNTCNRLVYLTFIRRVRAFEPADQNMRVYIYKMLERHFESVLALFQRNTCHPVSPGGLGTIISWRLKYHLSNFDTLRFTQLHECAAVQACRITTVAKQNEK